ncbi:outer membrane protein assembly factor BamB family protein [Halosimplex marinum]|uniref:outer membrane protein assembly factor BamB family protein n=1 Tax=Halosimplex marinum TaxID=3396620 RepID=UPI003F572B30
MRTRTAAALALLVLAFAGAGAVALWALPAGDGGSLSEVWVSDTARDNEFNHHGVGAADGVVVAPVTALQGQDGLTRRSCSLERLAAADGSVRWWAGVPPDRCFSHALTRPAVADLNGDGALEVVAGTTQNATVAVAASDGRELFRVPTRAYGYAQPTVADVTGDSDPEIVASDISGDVFVATADGAVRWRGNLSTLVYAPPVVSDIDGDGEREVVVAGREETVAFEPDGTVRWRRGVGANDAATATVGGESVVVVAGNDGVVALDGATGDRRWNRSAEGSPAMGALADADGDGTPEAYVSEAGNVLRALDAADGDEEWRTRLATSEGAVTPPAVLADPDGDRSRELVAVTNGGTVAVLDPATGAERAAYERDVAVWTGVTPANLTAAPGDELLVRYGDGRVVALEYGS